MIVSRGSRDHPSAPVSEDHQSWWPQVPGAVWVFGGNLFPPAHRVEGATAYILIPSNVLDETLLKLSAGEFHSLAEMSDDVYRATAKRKRSACYLVCLGSKTGQRLRRGEEVFFSFMRRFGSIECDIGLRLLMVADAAREDDSSIELLHPGSSDLSKWSSNGIVAVSSLRILNALGDALVVMGEPQRGEVTVNELTYRNLGSCEVQRPGARVTWMFSRGVGPIGCYISYDEAEQRSVFSKRGRPHRVFRHPEYPDKARIYELLFYRFPRGRWSYLDST